MANLIGAIIARYEDDADTDATALRGALGSNQMEPDRADNLSMPYCVVSEIGTARDSESKQRAYRLDTVSVQFDVYDRGKADVDSILEAIEDCYIGHTLTITDRTHIRTDFNFRLCEIDPDDGVFHGVIELEFMLEKRPA